MVTCYLTGTKFDTAQGFVLNRRWVREQINTLNEQSARFELHCPHPANPHAC